ncbi:hypothetical protein VNO80_30371 [Phaseolus coccineus]|uniref:Uncharacterized protein n=1 Tax=Phaseolus coccineus TaxID=3886 RepID=A0AAN9LDT3_PHACN
MGNEFSMEHHKWSGATFPEEDALVWTSHTEKSKRSVFRLRVNPEMVLLRLGESVCDDHPGRLFHMELSAQKDNMNCFNLGKVTVVVDGTSQQTQSKGKDSLSDLCERKRCFYEVMRKVESSGSVERVSWEFSHSFRVTLTAHIRYHVIIECDKETGLKAKIRGPFKCEDQVLGANCVPRSLIQRVVNEEPSKAIRAFAESDFLGKEYILFHGASDKRSVIIDNTRALFHGHGNASEYKDCNIIMQTFVGKSLSP